MPSVGTSSSGLFDQSGGKGSSAAENQIAGSQTDFMKTLQQDFGTTFSGQQNILSGLAKSASSILQGGPSQFGFSAPELTARNTLATTANAAATRNAMTIAGAAGGSDLPSGANGARQAQIAVAQGQDLSNKLLGIQEAGYDAGRQNYQNAESTLLSTAHEENPTAYAGQANSAGSEAFNSANTIQKQNQAASPWGQVGGLVGSLAGTALNMFAPGAGTALGALGGLASKVGQSNQNFQNTYQPQSIASGSDFSIPYEPMQSLNLSSSLYPSSYSDGF